jgi:hypothetical protein
MNFDRALDYGNPWTDDLEVCRECGITTDDYDWIDNEPICRSCQYHSDFNA